MHDHPSDFITLVLKGSYTDHYYVHPELAISKGAELTAYDEMTPGRICRRRAEHAHVVEVHEGGCWTLLYFFPQRRRWGFYRSRRDGRLKWVKSNKYFLEEGHHPCDQL